MRQNTPSLVVGLSLIGGGTTLFGTYWDDAWHTDRGRDSFTIPPHLLLYSGLLIIGIAALLWAFVVWRREKHLRSVVGFPPLLLALIGDAVTFVAVPIDNAWHLAFGRDAVLWSPPHLLAVAGMLAVGSGLLLGLKPAHGWRGYLLTSAVATLVLGASQIPLMEYEADVPQFATVWYLPVMTVGLMFALSILSAADGRPGIGTLTALLYTGIRVGVVGFLLLLGFSYPLVPPILVPALVYDLVTPFRWPRSLKALLITCAVYASYVPYLNVTSNGMHFTRNDILVGILLAFAGSWGILNVVEAPCLRWRPHMAGILLIVLFLLPKQALAHDPGQGQNIGTAQLQARVQDTTVLLTTTIIDRNLCEQLVPQQVEARRGGQFIRGPLHSIGTCQFQGVLHISEPGRWFVYDEWSIHSQHAETWLPVEVTTSTTQAAKRASLYLQETTSGSIGEIVSAIILYGGILIFLGTILQVVRRFSASRGT